MGSQELNTSLYKYSSKEVYDKTSNILAIIDAHLDAKCPHCLDLLKSGLGNHPNTNTNNIITSRSNLHDYREG